MIVDARLVLPAVSCWLAAGVLVALPDAAAWSAAACWLVAIVAAATYWLLLRRGRSSARIRSIIGALVLCSCAAGVAAGAITAAQPARRPAALTVGSGTSVVVVNANVDSVPRIRMGGSRSFADGQQVQFRVVMTSVSTSSQRLTVRAPALVFAAMRKQAATALAMGTTIELHGTLRASAPEDESAFLLFASGDPVTRAPPAPLLEVTNGLRSGFAAAAERLPSDGGALLPGLAIGDVSRVSVTLDSSMKASSLSHLTAVSGANCAVVIAVVMVAGAAAGLGRRIRVTAALLALGGFVVLVTPGASVLRAAVMAVIVVFSTAAGRPGRGVPALALAVILLLIGDPWLSRNYGFALSVLATAGLLVLAPRLAAHLARWMPGWLAASVAIPLAAQLACQPVLILLNPSLPLYGVGANLLAEPAAPIATMLGLLACMLLPVIPGLGFACAQLAWLPSAWIAGVARVASALPSSALPWAPGVAGVLLMSAVVSAVMILLSRRTARAHRLVRRITAVCLILSVGAYLGGVIGDGAGRRLGMPTDWALAACDIGQGDAVLVQDGSAHGLVDVGPDPALLTTCLDRLGVSRIDLLVLTHYDKDHVGGVAAVLGRVHTALVGQPTDAHDQRIIDSLVSSGADVRIAGSGDSGRLGSTEWQVVWPTAGGHAMQTGNEGSVTVEFSGGGIRSIFLGDLDERAQNALSGSGRVGPVDVVKVAHHGSADQSERLYALLTPRVGLISVGASNDYGHPTARLLGILGRVGTRPFRTDLQGLVLVSKAGGGRLAVWTDRSATDTALREPGPSAAVAGPR